MQNFEYTALDKGVRSSGVIQAGSLQEARTKLSSSGKVVLKILQSNNKKFGSASENQTVNTPDKFLQFISVRKSSVEISMKQLASVLTAGVPIMTALSAIGNQAPTPLKKIFDKVSAKVRRGYSLKRSFEEEAPILGQVSLGLIGVGEANGTLDEMLSYSAELMERARKVKGQIIQAFAYPILVILIAFGVGFYMVTQVLPEIISFISSQGHENVVLPLPTRILIQVSDFLELYGLYVLATPAVIITTFVLAKKSKQFGLPIDRALLYLPLLGRAFRFYCNAMWCRTLGALLQSGVDIITAIDLVHGTMENRYYSIQFVKLKEMIRQGSSLTAGIEATALKKLCPMSLTMVSVSETSGGLDESLFHVAKYSEENLEARVSLLSKFIEPAIFVVVGSMVGFLYFAVIMAMMTATRYAS